jgi:hypothetical protein
MAGPRRDAPGAARRESRFMPVAGTAFNESRRGSGLRDLVACTAPASGRCRACLAASINATSSRANYTQCAAPTSSPTN